MYSLTASAAAVLPLLQEQDMQEQALIQQVCRSCGVGMMWCGVDWCGCAHGTRKISHWRGSVVRQERGGERLCVFAETQEGEE